MTAATLGIGDFARATHLTIKTLRHYHRIGLLEPAEVDEFSGYRRYGTDQIPRALMISGSAHSTCHWTRFTRSSPRQIS